MDGPEALIGLRSQVALHAEELLSNLISLRSRKLQSQDVKPQDAIGKTSAAVGAKETARPPTWKTPLTANLSNPPQPNATAKPAPVSTSQAVQSDSRPLPGTARPTPGSESARNGSIQPPSSVAYGPPTEKGPTPGRPPFVPAVKQGSAQDSSIQEKAPPQSLNETKSGTMARGAATSSVVIQSSPSRPRPAPMVKSSPSTYNADRKQSTQAPKSQNGPFRGASTSRIASIPPGSNGGVPGEKKGIGDAVAVEAKLTPEELVAKIGSMKKRLNSLQAKSGAPMLAQLEPPRRKSQWDFVLEEMAWMANDFHEERQWKIFTAARLAREAAAKNQAEVLLERQHRELARNVAGKVNTFWRSMERVEFLTRIDRQSYRKPHGGTIGRKRPLEQASSGKNLEKSYANGPTGSLSSPANPLTERKRQDKPTSEMPDSVQKLLDSIWKARELANKQSSDTEYERQTLSAIGPELAAYQVEAVRFIRSLHTQGYGAILADEAALNKAIAVSAYVRVASSCSSDRTEDAFVRPDTVVSALFIVPESSLSKWAFSLSTLCPQHSLFVLHSEDRDRSRVVAQMTEAIGGSLDSPKRIRMACVASYRSFLRNLGFLSRLGWSLQVLESTLIQPAYIRASKDEPSRTVSALDAEVNAVNVLKPEVWDALAKIKAAYHLVLSDKDVPVDQDTLVRWGRFLLPVGSLDDKLLESSEAPTPRSFEGHEPGLTEGQSALRAALLSLSLRRTNAGLKSQLPIAQEEPMACKLTESQIAQYGDALMSSSLVSIDGLVHLVLRLRGLCNSVDFLSHERLAAADINSMLSASGKLSVLSSLLERLGAEKRKVAIYAQMGEALEMLEVFLSLKGLTYVRIVGDITAQQRGLVHFASKEKVFVALLSTRSSNHDGKNAARVFGASAVIVFDSDWDQSVESKLQLSWQEMASSNPLKVYRLFCEGTVEASLAKSGFCLSQRLFVEYAPREFFIGGSGGMTIETIQGAVEAAVLEQPPPWWVAVTAQQLLDVAGDVEEHYNLTTTLSNALRGGNLSEAEEAIPKCEDLKGVEWYALRWLESSLAEEKQEANQRAEEMLEVAPVVKPFPWTRFNEELFYDVSASSDVFTAYKHELHRLEQRGVQHYLSIYLPPAILYQDVGEATQFAKSPHLGPRTEFDILFRKVLVPKPVRPPTKPLESDTVKPKVKKTKKTGATVPEETRKRKRSVEGSGQTDRKKKQSRSDSIDSIPFSGLSDLNEDELIADSLLSGVGKAMTSKAESKQSVKVPKAGKPSKRKGDDTKNKEAWTTLEDLYIKQGVEAYGPNWALIADIINTRCKIAGGRRRSAKQCAERFSELQAQPKDKVKQKETPAKFLSLLAQKTHLLHGVEPMENAWLPATQLSLPHSAVTATMTSSFSFANLNGVASVPPARENDRRRLYNVFDHILRCWKARPVPPSVPGTDDPRVAIAKPHASHAQAAANAGAVKTVLTPVQLLELKRKSKDLSRAATSTNESLGTTSFGSSALSTNLSRLESSLRRSPHTIGSSNGHDVSSSGSMLDSASLATAQMITDQNSINLAQNTVSASHGGSMNVTTSTLFYVIEKVPEIKSQIQSVLQRKDCTEAQKVEMIARLLKSTNHATMGKP